MLYGFQQQTPPSRLGDRPAYRRLPLDLAPRRLASRGAEFPLRFIAVPAPFALSRHTTPSGFIPRPALENWAQSASRTSALGLELRIEAMASTKKLRASEVLFFVCWGFGSPPEALPMEGIGLHQCFHEFSEGLRLESGDFLPDRLRDRPGDETSGDCTAIVRGPEGESTREHMRTAVENLLQRLQ